MSSGITLHQSDTNESALFIQIERSKCLSVDYSNLLVEVQQKHGHSVLPINTKKANPEINGISLNVCEESRNAFLCSHFGSGRFFFSGGANPFLFWPQSFQLERRLLWITESFRESDSTRSIDSCIFLVSFLPLLIVMTPGQISYKRDVVLGPNHQFATAANLIQLQRSHSEHINMNSLVRLRDHSWSR